MDLGLEQGTKKWRVGGRMDNEAHLETWFLFHFSI